MRPRSAIIIVDVQNDFITGSLSISNCQAGQNGEDVRSYMMIIMIIMIIMIMIMMMIIIMIIMIITRLITMRSKPDYVEFVLL